MHQTGVWRLVRSFWPLSMEGFFVFIDLQVLEMLLPSQVLPAAGVEVAE